jgi:ATP-dependent exoDNAse (exonuclease V) beta subunit
VSFSPFRIYNASAGSGKTYQLVSEYLFLILSKENSFNFDQILAITFTNKAANEMKSRILEQLFDFSSPDILSSPSELFKTLSEKLEVDKTTLHKRAQSTLKLILHNYASFDISTIDKFNFRLLQTFAKDLKLPQNFEVVLEQELLLSEAVDRVINKAGTDKDLTYFLVSYAKEKIENDKSWDVAYDLNLMGKLLFDENQLIYLKPLKTDNTKDFLNYMAAFQKKMSYTEKVIIAEAKIAKDILEDSGLPAEAFPRKTLPKHFEKLLNKDFDPLGLYNNKLSENLSGGNILNKGYELPNGTFVENIFTKYRFIKEKIFYLSLLKNAYNNLVPLTLLNEIQNEIDNIQSERDQISISFFNDIISHEIQNQPAPYIYERLGEKYRHYFIDEFQDTSIMQWANLIPLVENALESTDEQGNIGSLMLVGDLKQAIYRWRGGEAEQFLNLINQNTNPFVTSAEIRSLSTNYRSRDEVINFNNDFFQTISSTLLKESYEKLYLNGNDQKFSGKKGGLVKLSFLEQIPENRDLVYCNAVLESIKESLDQEYSFSDLCILTRTKNQGVLLANFLVKNDIPIISSESLLLNNNPKIVFIINLLRFVISPDDLSISFEILEFLCEKSPDKHSFIENNLRHLDALLYNEYGFNSELFRQKTLFDVLEEVIKKMGLSNSSDAYLTYFMELVFEVEQKEDPSVFTFLSEWEKVKEKKSIVAPENIDAVQIMTIHKSKGLEFPVVIYPFANSKIFDSKEGYLWVPIKEIDDEKNFLISYKAEVQNYGPKVAELYMEERSKLQLDAYDLLYVVLTRAIDKLIILTEKKQKPKSEGPLNDYSDLFLYYLKSKSLWENSKDTYYFGELSGPKTRKKNNQAKNFIPYSLTYKDTDRFKIITKNATQWDEETNMAIKRGNVLHYAMGLVKTKDDIEFALDHIKSNNKIDQIPDLEIRKTLEDIVNHPLLSEFFASDCIVKNESEIINKNGVILRPDRLVFRDNSVSIIDYKTGKKSSIYSEQVQQYADTLKSMGYLVDKKVLVYIGGDILTEFL